LRRRYVALIQERPYVVESDRPIRPDVSIIHTGRAHSVSGSAAAIETDVPAVFEFSSEEIPEPLIPYHRTRRRHRIVTAIEVLSPGDKLAGTGRIA
jgi:hypothetical protein